MPTSIMYALELIEDAVPNTGFYVKHIVETSGLSKIRLSEKCHSKLGERTRRAQKGLKYFQNRRFDKQGTESSSKN